MMDIEDFLKMVPEPGSPLFTLEKDTDEDRKKSSCMPPMRMNGLRGISFTVTGLPVAKARPRLGKGGNTYTPQRTVNYETVVGLVARSVMGNNPFLEPPIRAHLTFYFPYRKKKYAGKKPAYYVSRPDLDNLEKAILDACNGIIYKDDAGVASVWKVKRLDDFPRVEVLFREIEDE